MLVETTGVEPVVTTTMTRRIAPVLEHCDGNGDGTNAPATSTPALPLSSRLRLTLAKGVSHDCPTRLSDGLRLTRPRLALVSLVSPRGTTPGLDPDAACCAASCPHNAGAVHPTSPDVTCRRITTHHWFGHALGLAGQTGMLGIFPYCVAGTMHLRLCHSEDLGHPSGEGAAGEAFPLTAHQQWQRGECNPAEARKGNTLIFLGFLPNTYDGPLWHANLFFAFFGR